ncbi:hypothetical protein AQUCO_08300085v1 [Aquilegia coerulea]|uniref:C2 domain-containing protein n=1 Tax=Aquilegia coerulea TaxID=218851 RepID=A0A2G5C795_AQUCA|nr:hypothetical protein AQUCO_08300085v1 [Aquilegia coerulea]
MSGSRIHGQELEVTIVSCNNLENTHWISKPRPYVRLEYGSLEFKTSKSKGTRPIFQEKFVFTAIEGLQEINIHVFDSNSLSNKRFIGGGSVQLKEVLSNGRCETTCTLQTTTSGGSHCRFSGEVRLVMRCPNFIPSMARTHRSESAPSTPQYFPSPLPAHPFQPIPQAIPRYTRTGNKYKLLDHHYFVPRIQDSIHHHQHTHAINCCNRQQELPEEAIILPDESKDIILVQT